MKELVFYNCIINERNIHFFDDKGLPGIIDLDTNRMRYMPGITNFRCQPWDMSIFHQGKIYAVSVSGKDLMVYDLDKAKCEYFFLGCDENPWGNFISIFAKNQEVFIFPTSKRAIRVFNIEKKEIKIINNCEIENTDYSCSCNIDDEIWLVPRNGKQILVFNMVTKVFNSMESDLEIKNCVHAIHRKGKIYILNKFGGIYVWDIKGKKMDCFLAEQGQEKSAYGRIIYAGKRFILLPSLADNIQIIDMDKKEKTIYRDYPKDFGYSTRKWSKYYGYCEDENYIYFAMRSANYILKIDKNTGNIDWVKPILSEKEKYQCIVSYSVMLISEQQLSLDELLKNVKKRQGYVGNDNIIHSGEKIWRDITVE